MMSLSACSAISFIRNLPVTISLFLPTYKYFHKHSGTEEVWFKFQRDKISKLGFTYLMQFSWIFQRKVSFYEIALEGNSVVMKTQQFVRFWKFSAKFFFWFFWKGSLVLTVVLATRQVQFLQTIDFEGKKKQCSRKYLEHISKYKI